MQNSETAKTKWAPKSRLLGVGYLAAVVAVLLSAWWLWQPAGQVIKAGNTRYNVDVADTDAERKQGLSGRQDLAHNAGMLFIYPQPGKRCIWMKDMKFSIDIVWLDQQKRVISVLERVSPDTYPMSFCPRDAALYVVELNAGQTQAAGIREGQTFGF
jgi:uncharacterized protein